MKTFRESVTVTPVIAAAMRRPARAGRGEGGGGRISHNYLAEIPLTLGQVSKTAKRAGAPPGNLNAARHGKGNPDVVALFAKVRAFRRRARVALKLVKQAQRDGRQPDAVALRATLERS